MSEQHKLFPRRWMLARDGFGLQRDDEDGAYVHIDDACAVLAARSTHKQGEAPKVCGVCFEDEAFTGTCGGGRENPRALCFQGAPSPSVEPAHEQESPTYSELISELAALRDGLKIVVDSLHECEFERTDLREQIACVRQALPQEWRESVPSVAVATLVAELEARAAATPLQQVEPGWPPERDAARWRFFNEHANDWHDGKRVFEWVGYHGVMRHGSRNAAIDHMIAAAPKEPKP